MKLPLLSRFLPHKKEQLFLALDLGTTTIKAAVFKSKTEMTSAKIVGIGTQPVIPGSMQAGLVEDFDAVVTSIDAAIEEAAIKAGDLGTKAIIGLSGGMMYAKGLRVRAKRKKPDTPLVEKEFATLADYIEDQTLEKAQQDLSKRFGEDLVRVETVFTAYAMDGATVDSPLGLPGEELEVSVLHYFMNPKCLRIVNNIADELGLEILAIVDTSVNYAAHLVQAQPSCIIIDIGGVVTEVIMVDDGKIITNELFIMGGSDITWQIQQDLQLDADKAERLKMQYVQGHLEGEQISQVRQSVDFASHVWVEGIATILSEMGQTTYPSKIILTGEGRHVAELKSAIIAYPWSKMVHFETFPSVTIAEGQLPNIEALIQIEV